MDDTTLVNSNDVSICLLQLQSQVTNDSSRSSAYSCSPTTIVEFPARFFDSVVAFNEFRESPTEAIAKQTSSLAKMRYVLG